MTELTDHELLADFARNESEPAFAELVARHVNLVYSTALRFTGNPHHAEEITQAVFIILARKAGKLSPRVVFSGWLYQATRLTAANFMKGEIRRQNREQEAYMQSTLNEAETTDWQQIAPHLDDAMGRLGEADRNAVVLRFFENKTAAEIAASLKTTEAAAHKRVNRALAKLRKIFVKRGVAYSSIAIAGAISAKSVHAAPTSLAKTVSAGAIAKGATVSGSTLTLVKGALKIMAWTKAKIVVGALVLAGVATTLVIHHHNQQKTVLERQSQANGKAAAIAKMNRAQQIVAGMLMYAHDHGNQFPTDFAQVVSYIKKNPITQDELNQFEIVYHGSQAAISDPHATIVVMDKKPWLTDRGTLAKVYAYADGHSEVRVAPFEAFEKGHTVSPSN